MKYKTILLICICFISASLCTGCWNYHELSDFAIITGIGIDKKDDEFELSVMIANASNSNSSTKEGQAVETIVVGTGNSITEAYNDIEKKVSKDLYTGHLELLLVNEDIAKKSLYDVLDPILRDPESIKKLYLVIAKNTSARKILETLSPLQSFSVQKIIDTLELANTNLGFTTNTILSEYIGNIINIGKDNILPSVTIEGKVGSTDNADDLKESEVSSEIKLSNLSIFNDYKLVGYVNEDAGKGINVINNNAKSLNIKSVCYKDNDKYIISKIDSPKTEISLEKDKDELTYLVKVTASGSINETNCILDLKNEKVISNINNTVTSDLYDLLDKALKVSQKYRTDIFGLGDILYKKDYKYWNKIKDNWDHKLESVKFKIEVNLDLKTKGSLETTIKEKEYEKN